MYPSIALLVYKFNFFFFLMLRRPLSSPLLPYTSFFRSRSLLPIFLHAEHDRRGATEHALGGARQHAGVLRLVDRKSTRLNSSHSQISYAVFCLKKKIRYSLQSYDQTWCWVCTTGSVSSR